MNQTNETPVPAEFWLGIEQFNQGEFYACHDTLEAIWMEALDPDRTFYQGILQIAVGLYHLSNYNWRGCVTLMGEGIRRLQPYQPSYAAIAVTPFVAETQVLLRTLQHAGPEQVQPIADQIIAHYRADSVDGAGNPLPPVNEYSLTGLEGEDVRSPMITRVQSPE